MYHVTWWFTVSRRLICDGLTRAARVLALEWYCSNAIFSSARRRRLERSVWGAKTRLAMTQATITSRAVGGGARVYALYRFCWRVLVDVLSRECWQPSVALPGFTRSSFSHASFGCQANDVESKIAREGLGLAHHRTIMLPRFLNDLSIWNLKLEPWSLGALEPWNLQT